MHKTGSRPSLCKKKENVLVFESHDDGAAPICHPSGLIDIFPCWSTFSIPPHSSLTRKYPNRALGLPPLVWALFYSMISRAAGDWPVERPAINQPRRSLAFTKTQAGKAAEDTTTGPRDRAIVPAGTHGLRCAEVAGPTEYSAYLRLLKRGSDSPVLSAARREGTSVGCGGSRSGAAGRCDAQGLLRQHCALSGSHGHRSCRLVAIRDPDGEPLQSSAPPAPAWWFGEKARVGPIAMRQLLIS